MDIWMSKSSVGNLHKSNTSCRLTIDYHKRALEPHPAKVGLWNKKGLPIPLKNQVQGLVNQRNYNDLHARKNLCKTFANFHQGTFSQQAYSQLDDCFLADNELESCVFFHLFCAGKDLCSENISWG